MNPNLFTSSKKTITLDVRLGSGGEGEVWSVKERLEVAKLYHPAILRSEHERKIQAMIENPPKDKMRSKGHVSIAWPTEALYQKGKFAGFLMPRIERSPTIFAMYNPKMRQRECPGFTWKYLMQTALNLSIAIDAIHVKQYVIGDLNESNVLVAPSALVSIIDTDSFQVRDQAGHLFGCRVGKEDFLPPELQGIDLEKVERLPEHDYYGLGVLIFRLLMEGVHPFTGVLKSNLELTDSTQYYCQKVGAFPYDPKNKVVLPPIIAPRFETLPPAVQQLLTRCFVNGHQNPSLRPSAAEWVQCLELAGNALSDCPKNTLHVYSSHLTTCPWCDRDEQRRDGKLQIPLPPAATSRSKPAPNPGRGPSQKPTPAPNKHQAAAAAVQTPPAPIPQPVKVVPPAAAVPQPVRPIQARQFIQPSRQSLRNFFISAGQHLNWRIWLAHTWKYSLGGTAGGLGLFGLIYVIFAYTTVAGYAVGVAAAAAVGFLGWKLAQFLNMRRNYYVRVSGILTLIVVVIFAGFIFVEVSQLTQNYLSGYLPNMYWVLAESTAAGLIWGTAVGSYTIIARRKSQAIAVLAASGLGLLPLAMFLLLSQSGIP